MRLQEGSFHCAKETTHCTMTLTEHCTGVGADYLAQGIPRDESSKELLAELGRRLSRRGISVDSAISAGPLCRPLAGFLAPYTTSAMNVTSNRG